MSVESQKSEDAEQRLYHKLVSKFVQWAVLQNTPELRVTLAKKRDYPSRHADPSSLLSPAEIAQVNHFRQEATGKGYRTELREVRNFVPSDRCWTEDEFEIRCEIVVSRAHPLAE